MVRLLLWRRDYGGLRSFHGRVNPEGAAMCAVMLAQAPPEINHCGSDALGRWFSFLRNLNLMA